MRGNRLLAITPWHKIRVAMSALKNKLLRQTEDADAPDLMLSLLGNQRYIAAIKTSPEASLTYIEPLEDNNGLKSYIDKHELKGCEVYGVLCDDSYQLIVHDMMGLEDDEIHEAIRWQIDDIAGIEPEEVAVDGFRIPDQGKITNSGYVALRSATDTDKLQQQFEALEVRLEGLNIAELGFARVIYRLFPEDEQVQAVLYFSANRQVHLLLIRQGLLLFTRKLGKTETLLDIEQDANLANECRRSIDYARYQRQLSPQRLLLTEPIDDAVAEALSGEVNLETEVFGQSLTDDATKLNTEQKPFLLPLLGVAD